MKLLVLVYSGPDVGNITRILDAQPVPGYTVLDGAKGVGGTGRVEGTRAWPGASSVILSFIPTAVLEPVQRALLAYRDAHSAGERLHLAAVPMELYF
jgi:hypothetical protein